MAGFARNPHGYCWANLLRDRLEKTDDCRVTNNGCSGTDIEFILRFFDSLVDPDDDIVLCMIGTNNRHQYFSDSPQMSGREYMERFYQNILALHNRFRAAGIDAIFCACIPASAENEQDGPDYRRLFHMNDVHDLYMKASCACGFPFISLYTAFQSYCAERNILPDALLADGLHPNDEGHRVIYELLMKETGLSAGAGR